MRAKILLKSFIVLALPLLFSAAHPFYLSVLDLKYNSQEKALQGSLRVFTNDFERALSVKEKKRVDLINPPDKAAAEKIIADYLQKNLRLHVNESTVNIEVLGFEKIEESIWVYLEAKSAEPVSIKIRNSILCQSISQQSNIMHIEVHGEQKSVKLDCPESFAEIGF